MSLLPLAQQLQSGDLGERIPEAPSAPDIPSLTRRLVQGEDLAYTQFFRAYHGRLFRYLLVVSGGEEDLARQALSETYRRLVRHIRVFEVEQVFWSWLTRLGRSALSDERRGRRRYWAFLERFATLGGTDAPVHEPDDLLCAFLEEEIDQLPQADRELLQEKYQEKRTVAGIAQALGLTNKAVESRLARLRGKLREALKTRIEHEKHHG